MTPTTVRLPHCGARYRQQHKRRRLVRPNGGFNLDGNIEPLLRSHRLALHRITSHIAAHLEEALSNHVRPGLTQICRYPSGNHQSSRPLLFLLSASPVPIWTCHSPRLFLDVVCVSAHGTSHGTGKGSSRKGLAAKAVVPHVQYETPSTDAAELGSGPLVATH